MTGCWIWQGAKTQRGDYGVIQLGRGVGTKRTHIVVYEAYVGPVPDGLTLDHRCPNNACCNPAHLEPVTRAENTRRQWAAGRANAGARNAEKTHCPRGHAYDAENTKMAGGRRQCRACARERARERRALARARLPVVDPSESVDVG